MVDDILEDRVETRKKYVPPTVTRDPNFTRYYVPPNTHYLSGKEKQKRPFITPTVTRERPPYTQRIYPQYSLPHNI